MKLSILLVAMYILICVFEGIALADGGVEDSAAAKSPPCPTSPGLDSDGMPLCPDAVENDDSGAWMVWRCGYDLVHSWHSPTAAESAASHQLIDAWYAARKDGKSPATTQKMVAAVTSMGGQICRVPGSDPYLVVWAAKADYSGGNLLLRESTNTTNMVLIAPHSDSDGYYAAFPQSIKGTHYLAAVGEGHHRGNVSQGKDSDFVHHTPNLAYTMLEDILNTQKNQYYMLHLHGDQASTKFLLRPLDNAPFTKAYITAAEAATRVTTYSGLNAYFVTDNLPFKQQVKSEMPAVIWLKNHESMGRIIQELEKNAFLWPSPTLARAFATPEQAFQDGEVPSDIITDEDGEENVPDPDGILSVVENLAAKPSPSPTPWAGPPHLSRDVGSHPINAVVPQWTDVKPQQQALAQSAATTVAKFYERMSRGRLTMQPKGILMDVNAPAPHGASAADKAALAAACQKARALGGWKTMLFDTFRHGGQHASGCAYLTQYLGWVDEHEVGHLLGLAHAGTYGTDPKTGAPVYNQYGDNGNSVMADAVGSPVLTMEEVYYLGWLDKSEYALVQAPATATYTIYSIDHLSDGAKDVTFAVILHQDLVAKLTAAQNRPLMIAYPHNCAKKGGNPCVSLTYMDAASATLRNVAGEFKDPISGLHVKVLGSQPNAVTVQVGFE